MGLEEVLLEASYLADVALDDDLVGDLGAGFLDGENLPSHDEFGAVFFVSHHFTSCGAAFADIEDHLFYDKVISVLPVKEGYTFADHVHFSVAAVFGYAVVYVENARVALSPVVVGD